MIKQDIQGSPSPELDAAWKLCILASLLKLCYRVLAVLTTSAENDIAVLAGIPSLIPSEMAKRLWNKTVKIPHENYG